MYTNCICCSVELTEDNSYRNSFSCKECQRRSNKKRKKKRMSQKLADRILKTKTCKICNTKDHYNLFFLLNKNISLYTEKELEILDAVHLDCLISSQKNRPTSPATCQPVFSDMAARHVDDGIIS